MFPNIHSSICSRTFVFCSFRTNIQLYSICVRAWRLLYIFTDFPVKCIIQVILTLLVATSLCIISSLPCFLSILFPSVGGSVGCSSSTLFPRAGCGVGCPSQHCSGVREVVWTVPAQHCSAVQEVVRLFLAPGVSSTPPYCTSSHTLNIHLTYMPHTTSTLMHGHCE